MGDTTKIPLTSAEISGLWNSYMGDSLSIRVTEYFLNRVEDTETHTILQHTNDISNQHVSEITELFNQAGLPIPEGFTDNDVNINAPRLFTDSFYLHYISFMARVGMHNYTLILNQIARSDIRDYFSKRINETVELYNQSTELRLSKGIAIRAPFVETPKKVQYIKGQSFMFDFFGEKRPMLLGEVTQLFGITFSNIVGKAISTGFGQVTKNEKVSNYFFEGTELASKIIKELTLMFENEDIPIPSSSDSFLTDSTVAPFSEKLMLTLMLVLSSSGVSSFGIALSQNIRSDLQTKYLKYTAEIMKFSQKGANLMIEKEWLEQPPITLRHKDLVGL